MAKAPNILVVLNRQYKVKRKLATELLARDVIYLDDAGDSVPREPHYHLNPERSYSFADVESLLLMIKEKL